jgi:hypothetical protein
MMDFRATLITIPRCLVIKVEDVEASIYQFKRIITD